MSMHLVGPYMTTTNYKKRKPRNKTQTQIKAEQQHDKWLRKMGVHPSQLAEKKQDERNRNIRNTFYNIPDYRTSSNNIPTSDVVAGSGLKKESQKYTGTLIKGIATMHKSNAVPITDRKQAIEVSQMRRS